MTLWTWVQNIRNRDVGKTRPSGIHRAERIDRDKITPLISFRQRIDQTQKAFWCEIPQRDHDGHPDAVLHVHIPSAAASMPRHRFVARQL